MVDRIVRSDEFWRELHARVEKAYSEGKKKSEVLGEVGVRSNVYWYNCQRLGLVRKALKGLPQTAKKYAKKNGKFLEFVPPGETKPIELEIKLGLSTATLRLHSPKQASEFITLMQAEMVLGGAVK